MGSKGRGLVVSTGVFRAAIMGLGLSGEAIKESNNNIYYIILVREAYSFIHGEG